MYGLSPLPVSHLPSLSASIDYAREECVGSRATIELMIDGFYAVIHQELGWPRRGGRGILGLNIGRCHRTANSYRLSQLAQKTGRANFLSNCGPEALTQCKKCGLTPS